MRLLVDTSVWSLALRKGGPADHAAVARLRKALEDQEDVFVTGAVLQEILQGLRSDAAFRKIAARLEPFPLLSLDRADYLAAARLRRTCAAHGVTLSTIDCQIAQAALRHDCHLLTTDQDFTHLSRCVPLRLA